MTIQDFDPLLCDHGLRLWHPLPLRLKRRARRDKGLRTRMRVLPQREISLYNYIEVSRRPVFVAARVAARVVGEQQLTRAFVLLSDINMAM